MLVQRDIMSAVLACYATEKGHDRSLLLNKWPAVEALLSGSGLCRHINPVDVDASQDAPATKPGTRAKARIPGTEKGSAANSEST